MATREKEKVDEPVKDDPPADPGDEGEARLRRISREEGKAGALEALEEFFSKETEQDPPKGTWDKVQEMLGIK